MVVASAAKLFLKKNKRWFRSG